MSSIAKIPFTLGKKSFVEIELLNQLGKVVATLTSREYDEGSYSLSLDAGNFPSGIYYIKMKADGKSFTDPFVIEK